MLNTLQFCVSSLRRGHANLLCIDPILVYVLPKQVHFYMQTSTICGIWDLGSQAHLYKTWSPTHSFIKSFSFFSFKYISYHKCIRLILLKIKVLWLYLVIHDTFWCILMFKFHVLCQAHFTLRPWIPGKESLCGGLSIGFKSCEYIFTCCTLKQMIALLQQTP